MLLAAYKSKSVYEVLQRQASNIIMLIGTFISILIKCAVFLGFIVNTNHFQINFIKGWNTAGIYFAYYCGFILLLLSTAFLLKKQVRVWYLISINLIVSLILIIDIWYYRGLETMPSLHILGQASNLENLSSSIFSMTSKMDFLFIGDFIIFFIIMIKFRDYNKNIKTSFLSFILTLVIGVTCILFKPISFYFSGKPNAKSAAFAVVDNEVSAIHLSPIGYHFLDLYTYWKDCRKHVLDSDEQNEIKSWYDSKLENLPDNSYKAMFKGKNLLLIQVESLENCVIGQSIGGQEVTPNLNKLLKNGLYFSNIHEQVNEGVSSDADLMINTSIYPVRRGSTFFRYPFNTYNSLPRLMQQEGYSTMALHPDKGSLWNWKIGLESIGFERCIDASSYNTDEVVNLGISDGSYFKQIEPIIAKQKQPFYTFLVTLSSHSPFNIADNYRGLTLDKDLDNTYFGGYLQSIHYTDKQIGIFLEQLQNDGKLDNTVVVVYGDHCGVHKYYSDSLSKIVLPEKWWVENNKHIPLIIYNKDIKGGEIKTIGGQIDIMPTISYLLGIDENKYMYTAMGRNLLKTEKNFVVLSNGTYVGEYNNEEEKHNAINGLNIADKIISGNYFGKD